MEYQAGPDAARHAEHSGGEQDGGYVAGDGNCGGAVAEPVVQPPGSVRPLKADGGGNALRGLPGLTVTEQGNRHRPGLCVVLHGRHRLNTGTVQVNGDLGLNLHEKYLLLFF